MLMPLTLQPPTRRMIYGQKKNAQPCGYALPLLGDLCIFFIIFRNEVDIVLFYEFIVVEAIG